MNSAWGARGFGGSGRLPSVRLGGEDEAEDRGDSPSSGRGEDSGDEDAGDDDQSEAGDEGPGGGVDD